MIIDVKYGEDWNAASRTVLGPISRELAASRDAAGEQYTVVLREPERPQPIAVLNIAWAHDYFGVWAYDDRGRRIREFDLRPSTPPRLSIDSLVWCAGCTAWRVMATLKGRGTSDDAGLRGPACGGRGHVDRLIT